MYFKNKLLLSEFGYTRLDLTKKKNEILLFRRANEKAILVNFIRVKFNYSSIVLNTNPNSSLLTLSKKKEKKSDT